MSNDLVSIETLKPLQVFGAENGVQTILEKLKEEAAKLQPDISTPAGRDAIRSLAAKLARSKTALDNMGKELTDDWAKKKKAVDAERRTLWEGIEELQHNVRKPLTDWENAEKDRVEGHERALENLAAIKNYIHAGEEGQQLNAEGLREKSAMSADLFHTRQWEEFGDRAKTQFQANESAFEIAIKNRDQFEHEQAELARLRREEEERKAEAERKRIADEAAAKAKAEAEAKAAADAKAAQEKADREKADLEAKNKAEAERAEKAERDRQQAVKDKEAADKKAAEEKAETEALHQKQLKEAKEKAERDAAAKVAADKKAEEEATAKREADKKHKAKINNAAAAAILIALQSEGDMEDAAKAVVVAIANNGIPHVKINY